jgi:plastocyanin
MKKHVTNTTVLADILCIIIILVVKSSWATNHVVQFGGSFGFAYSPKTFSATVGDTVQWSGDFSLHPISSTTIPANASSWHMGSGSSFIYVIKVPGAYNYQCDLHEGLGMTGSFNASETMVWQEGPWAKAVHPNHVMFVDAPASGKPSVSFFTPQTGFVTLEVFDILGHKIRTLLSQTIVAGTYSIPIKAENAAYGVYFIKLAAAGVDIIRTLRVLNN